MYAFAMRQCKLPLLYKQLWEDGRRACASRGCGDDGTSKVERSNVLTPQLDRCVTHEGSPQHI